LLEGESMLSTNRFAWLAAILLVAAAASPAR
jgi:hypothetical protein